MGIFSVHRKSGENSWWFKFLLAFIYSAMDMLVLLVRTFFPGLSVMLCIRNGQKDIYFLFHMLYFH